MPPRSRSTSPIAARWNRCTRRYAGHSARSPSWSRAPASSRSTPIVDITPEKWDRILAINLTGTFTCMQLAVPDMIAPGWGRIVTIASSSAQSGAPNMAHYVASKGGVIGLTKAFARELAGHGITVNTIPPTIVDTPMARNAEAAGDVPSIDVLGRHGAPRPGRDTGGHRRRMLVPVLGKGGATSRVR